MNISEKDILLDMLKNCFRYDICEECPYFSQFYNKCGCGKLPEILEILKSLLEI